MRASSSSPLFCIFGAEVHKSNIRVKTWHNKYENIELWIKLKDTTFCLNYFKPRAKKKKKKKKKPEFQLILWASSSRILLTLGHFFFVSVNDFVRVWIAWTLKGGQGSGVLKITCPGWNSTSSGLLDGAFVCALNPTAVDLGSKNTCTYTVSFVYESSNVR